MTGVAILLVGTGFRKTGSATTNKSHITPPCLRLHLEDTFDWMSCEPSLPSRFLLCPGRIKRPERVAQIRSTRAGPRVGQFVEASAPDFKVKMWSTGVSGAADLGDLLPLAYELSIRYNNGALLQVVVSRREHPLNVSVSDDNDVAAREAPVTATGPLPAVVTRLGTHGVALWALR
jgi:hypothetical protein